MKNFPEAITLKVCSDCFDYMFLPEYMDTFQYHYGKEAENLEAVIAGAYERANITLESSEGEPEFSWSPCECCHRPLGGDRHTITAIPLRDYEEWLENQREARS